MSTIAPVLDGTVAVSTVAALAVAPRASKRERQPGRGGFGPDAVLAVVVALILLNQLAFAVYVQRVHGGDPSFIARYLPPGWFAVPRGNPVVDGLAAHTPAPAVLAPSVLRVQAFLELPLVLLTFAAVLRRLDGSLYRRVFLSPLVPLAASSYTVAFCAVEWDLRNPYTTDDLLVRAVSALVTPVLLARLAAREKEPEGRHVTAPRLLLFALELWAYGALMLTLYDTALLYNLARLGDRLPTALAALAVLTVTRLAATRLAPRPAHPAGPRTTALAGALRAGLVLFLAPALAVRYAGSFGTPQLAAAAGAVVLITATARFAIRLALPAVAGIAAGWAAVHWSVSAYYEAALLQAATAALLATVAVCVLLDTIRKPLDALS
ncbi:hypothetical protein ACIBJD_23060 [Kitasatospora sp. NPDC050467]|uniref:hypothetical protein n=1 Tax=Kitasatospora sp. NPDC050467 TaxID=3364053 RepID=UPI0037B61447